MNELLSKVSSYNLFNYLLPGIVFAALAQDMIRLPIFQRDILSAAFLCYFVGLVISRVGSVILEPLLKRISFVKFADYRDYVNASKSDGLLETLSEVNNTYRTLSALFMLLGLLKIYVRVEAKYPFLRAWDSTLIVAALLFLFLFAYRKQTIYITKRISADKLEEAAATQSAGTAANRK
jgi:hypothetical protein